jgi:hypothetical protein
LHLGSQGRPADSSAVASDHASGLAFGIAGLASPWAWAIEWTSDPSDPFEPLNPFDQASERPWGIGCCGVSCDYLRLEVEEIWPFPVADGTGAGLERLFAGAVVD